MITSAMIFFLLSIHGDRVLYDQKDLGIEITLPQQYIASEIKPGSLLVVDYDKFVSIEKSDQCAYVVVCSPELGEPVFDGFSVAYIQTDKNVGQLLNEVIGVYCSLLEWGLKLKVALQTANPIKEVFLVGHSVYTRAFCLSDNYSSIIAYTPGAQVFNKPEFSNLDEALLDEEFILTENYTDIFLYPSNDTGDYLLCLNIHKENNLQLRVLAEIDTSNVSEGEKQLFRVLCEHIKLAYNKNVEGRLHRRQNDPIHSMLRKLLSETPGPDDEVFWHNLTDYGWHRTHHYLVALIEVSYHRDLEIFPIFLCNKLEFEWKESVALKANNGIVWIINQTLSLKKRTITDLFQSLACFLRDTVAKAGIGESFDDLVNIHEYHFQAETALRLGKSSKPDFWYYKFEDYIVDYFLESATRNVSKANLYYNGIRKLEKYDHENGTDLLVTFKHYAECLFNTGTASEKIYVHRSTLIRRIEKIKAICGFDLSNMDEVIHILLSFRMMKPLEPRDISA